ncbi:MAG: cytochrome c oxidase subunit II [Planctomycetes bacterium]|nr:cytochrome c oxidase subunit II [Planctomycetota bacterium]
MMADLALGNFAGLPLAQQAGGSFWFPPQASDVAAGVDFTYDLILWLCIIFFVLICGATLYFMVKYRKRPGHKEEVTSTHNTKLELAWSIIPLILLMVVFGVSTYWYLRIVTPPSGEVVEVEVTAKQWNWTFTYRGDGLPAGKNYMVVGELHLVRDQAYQMVMTTPQNDVIHSMFIPAFRVKQDCVPGRYNKLWFRAIKAPQDDGAEYYDLYCTEYCGNDHSLMLAKVFVHENKAEWAAAVIEAADISRLDPVDRGKSIFDQNCKSCHTVNGDPSTGPSWKGMWGREEVMEDGTKVTVDENYVRESVLQPAAKIVKGYPNAMTPFTWGDQTDVAIEGIVAYMKTLKD